MITLPVEFTTDLVANVVELLADFGPLLLVVIGIPFGVYVIKKVISLIPKR